MNQLPKLYNARQRLRVRKGVGTKQAVNIIVTLRRVRVTIFAVEKQ